MRIVFLAAVLTLLIVPAALAQTGKHVGIGGAIGVTSYTDKDFRTKNPGFALAYRLAPKPGTEGWRWGVTASPGWSNKNTSTEIGGTRSTLGKLQMVPILVGVQRSLRQGPWQYGGGILAGPSFNHYKVDQSARVAYLLRQGATLENIEVKNSVAVRPQVFAWYDLNERWGAQVLMSYTVNRPKAETTMDGVTTTSTWKTDHLSASVGVVFGLF